MDKEYRVFTTVNDNPGSTGTKYWVKYIKQRVKRNKNMMFPIIGQTGSGKSYAGAAWMGELGELRIDHVCFSASEFLQLLMSNTLKAGDVILWDEIGVGLNAKQWQSLTNRVINLVMQVYRNMNLVVIFTLPMFSFLDSDTRKLVHGLMKMKKIDYKNQTAYLQPFLIQVNEETGKMYKKYLRVKHNGGPLVPVKQVCLSKPPQDFLDLYEAKKKAFNTDVYARALATIQKVEQKEKLTSEGEPLTEKQKTVVQLYEQGKEQKEIAQILGISITAVYNHLNYARKKVKIKEIAKEKPVFKVFNHNPVTAVLNLPLEPNRSIDNEVIN